MGFNAEMYAVGYKTRQKDDVVCYIDRVAIFPDKYKMKGSLMPGVVKLAEIANTPIPESNYKFARMENVTTVLPEGYMGLTWFRKRGVPLKVHKGTYYSNVFIREEYRETTYIKAYLEDGTCVIQETYPKKKPKKALIYSQLEDAIEWEDITDTLYEKIQEDIENKSYSLSYTNYRFLGLVKPYRKVVIKHHKNGCIVAKGKFESLVIWNEGEEIYGTWMPNTAANDHGENIKATLLTLLAGNYVLPFNCISNPMVTHIFESDSPFLFLANQRRYFKLIAMGRNDEGRTVHCIFLDFSAITDSALNLDYILDYLKSYNAWILTNNPITVEFNWKHTVYQL